MVATAGAASAVSAGAQVPFRVTSPASGASVRETVRFQMSRRALGDAQYLTLTIDGDFRAGIDIPKVSAKGEPIQTPNVESNGSVVSVLWDTKAISKDPKVVEDRRVVKDGPHTVEIAAYNAGGQRVGAQTLTINVNNKGQLASRSGGILLSYALRVGDRTKYHQQTSVEYITDPQTTAPGQYGGGRAPANGGQGFGGGQGFSGGQGGYSGGQGGFQGGPPPGFQGGGFQGGRGGGRGRGGGGPNIGGYTPQQRPTGPVILPVQTVTANYERTVEDNNGGGSYLIRDKTLDGVIISGNGAASRLENVYTFKSRYRAVRPSGYVQEFVPASAAQPGAYVALPIIDLTGTRRRIGEQWTVNAPVLLEWATLNRPPMVETQNKLEGLEWQSGYQTARIAQTFTGKVDVPIFGGAGTIKGADVKMARTIWFAYKTQRVIRTETQTEVSGNAPANVLQQMVPGAGVGGGTGFGGGGFGGGFGGGDEGGGGGFPGFGSGGGGAISGGGGIGRPGAGFGGAQGAADVVLVPAKFRSNTVVSLDTSKGSGKRTVVVVRSRRRVVVRSGKKGVVKSSGVKAKNTSGVKMRQN